MIKECWIKQQSGGYEQGEVLEEGQRECRVFSKGQNKKVKKEYIYQRNVNKNVKYAGDLITLDILNEAEIFRTLKQRYFMQNIYTYIGSTLLCFNPFKKLNTSSKIYSVQNPDQPHILNLTFRVYSQLIQTKQNQVFLISGQSGSGKTQTLKYVIQYLSNKASQQRIHDKILACNPILQAFGNAKTQRNANSSRFGRFIKLYYINNKIIGATITKYLLQKARVTFMNPQSHNYHIFNLMLNCLDSNTLSNLYLNKNYEYNYLKNKSYLQYTSKQYFNILISSFEEIGFTKSEIHCVFQLLSIILNLGNIQYSQQTFQQGKLPCKITQKSQSHIKYIAQTLDNSETIVSNYLLYKQLSVGNSRILSPLKLSDCIKIRDSTSKYIYSSLFTYIVSKLNSFLNPQLQSTNSISLFDIFGFQQFKTNSLQQLLINYSNQSLHQIFLYYSFKSIQQDLKGIQIQFSDNQPIITAIQYSILNPLTDCCKLNNFNKFQIQPAQKYIQKQQLNFFLIKHTFKDVVYNIDLFCEKNISTTIKFPCNNMLLNDMLENNIRQEYISESFQKELKSLFEKQIKIAQTCFIRCVKSNNRQQPFGFDDRMVQQQIKCLGVLDIVRMRKEIGVKKINKKQFIEKYKSIANGYHIIEYLRDIIGMNILQNEQKVFLKEGQQKKLKQLLKQRQKQLKIKVNMIQQWYKKWRDKKRKKLKLIQALRYIDKKHTRWIKNRCQQVLIIIKSLKKMVRKQKEFKKECKQQKYSQKHFKSKEMLSITQIIKTKNKHYSNDQIFLKDLNIFPSNYPIVQTNIPQFQFQLKPIEYNYKLFTINKTISSINIQPNLYPYSIFQSYLLSNINYQKYSQNKEQFIANIITHSTKNQKNPLLVQTVNYLSVQAQFSFRCILKVMGQRGSRYSYLQNLNFIGDLMKGILKDKQREVNYEERILGYKYKSQQIENNLIETDNKLFQQKYFRLINSPIFCMRNQIYLQFIKQLTNNKNKESVEKGLNALKVLTRYYSPGNNFIDSMISYFASKYPQQNQIIQNLIVFKNKLSNILQQHSFQSFSFMQSRQSSILKHQLLSTSILIYPLLPNTLPIQIPIRNQTIKSIKQQILSISLFSSLSPYLSIQQQLFSQPKHQLISSTFIQQNQKLCDYLNQISSQLKTKSILLKIRIKYFFQVKKLNSNLIKLICCNCLNDYETMKQVRKKEEIVKYIMFQNNIDKLQIKMKQLNGVFFMNTQFEIVLFKFQPSSQNIRKMSEGIQLILIVSPKHLQIMNLKYTVLQTIPYNAIRQIGLTKGKYVCLMIKLFNYDIKVMSSNNIKMINQMINRYMELGQNE